jgi:hypothetical protein
MRTTTNYEQTITDFQQDWEGNDLDLMKTAMILEASHRLLKAKFKKPPTRAQVIEFSKTIAILCNQTGN